MEQLQGGRSQITRVEQTVIRPAGSWTPAVHALLTHVRAQGFFKAPEPLGFDQQGNEIVSYIGGHVSNYPLSAAATSQNALTSAASLLRAYHDAAATFLTSETIQFPWLLPTRAPEEVICHGDFAPYNVVLNGDEAIGIIDFDTAHPAPRTWDIAYALYRWAPLTDPANTDGFGSIREQINRACLFCDHYGLSHYNRKQLPTLIIERLNHLISYMITEANKGNKQFQANIKDGHHMLYQADAHYIQQHQTMILKGLLA